MLVHHINCCWSSPAQLFLVPSPRGLTSIFSCPTDLFSHHVLVGLQLNRGIQNFGVQHWVWDNWSSSLTLSGQMSIHNRNWYSSTMVKGRYMIESVSFMVLWSYFVHTSLVGTVCYKNVFRNVLSASSSHLEVIVCTSWEANALETLLHVSAIGMALRTRDTEIQSRVCRGWSIY
jgi:hypothetical protein